ncbi:UNVERIFIED_ORG: hypothetical protein ABID33_000539 [Xanthobacter viscosus]|uniref:Uncharacterized protein n=1 Tax=Xanthobacter autotrophicus TaxID=280 RepID=A0A6C1KT64_XANAU|nr:hypothetical protein [Xanthobacter autotrophicus]TLX43596.1 hypothetical protein FBQ73_05620 [Xanthobacter autotrophicus]
MAVEIRITGEPDEIAKLFAALGLTHAGKVIIPPVGPAFSVVKAEFPSPDSPADPVNAPAANPPAPSAPQAPISSGETPAADAPLWPEQPRRKVKNAKGALVDAPWTFTRVRDELVKAADRGPPDLTKQLLQAMGVERLSDLDAARYPELIALLDSIMNDRLRGPQQGDA